MCLFLYMNWHSVDVWLTSFPSPVSISLSLLSVLCLFSATASSVCEVCSCGVSTLLAFYAPPPPLLFFCLLPLSLLPLPLDVSSCISQLKLCRCVWGFHILTFFLDCFRTRLINQIKAAFEKTKAYQLASKSSICALNLNFIFKKKKKAFLDATSCNLWMSKICLDRKRPSQVLVAYKTVSFHVQLVLFCSLSETDVRVHEYNFPASVFRQDGNSIG